MKSIFKFEEKRTAGQALVFYLVFVLIGILLGAVAGGLTGGAIAITTGATGGFEVGMLAGTINAIIYSGILTWLVVSGRKLPVAAYLLVPVSSAIAIFGGAVIGVVIPAFLTTRGSSLE